jgi:hypothetical protein
MEDQPLITLVPLCLGFILLVASFLLGKNKESKPVKTLEPIEKSSLAQIKWLGKKMWGFVSGIFRHIWKFGLFYGFFAGIISTLLVIVAILWYGVFAHPLPWKVTDPRDPRFDPMEFRFTDYKSREEEETVFYSCFLSKGTEKAFVDKILVDAGGARVKEHKSKYFTSKYPEHREFSYTFRSLGAAITEPFFPVPQGEFNIRFSIMYDKDLKLTDANWVNIPCAKEN